MRGVVFLKIFRDFVVFLHFAVNGTLDVDPMRAWIDKCRNPENDSGWSLDDYEGWSSDED